MTARPPTAAAAASGSGSAAVPGDAPPPVAASLGFLGLGAQPPFPEWGAMISIARTCLPDWWWYSFFPGLAIFLTVLGFNLLGDGLRDVLDPQHRE